MKRKPAPTIRIDALAEASPSKSGPVKQYFLPPDELERYRQMPPPQVTSPSGKVERNIKYINSRTGKVWR